MDEADLTDIADSGETHGNGMRSMYSFNIDSDEEYEIMKDHERHTSHRAQTLGTC